MHMTRSATYAERALELALRHERDALSASNATEKRWSQNESEFWLHVAATIETGLFPIHPQARMTLDHMVMK